MTGRHFTTYEPEPMVMVDPEDNKITVAAHCGIVPLTFAEARQVVEAINALLLTFDQEHATQ